MSKKSLRQQTNKMLVAALFVMLCVGIYAHVDSWVTKREVSSKVLGRETPATISGNPAQAATFIQTVWCRLRYGRGCQIGVSTKNVTKY